MKSYFLALNPPVNILYALISSRTKENGSILSFANTPQTLTNDDLNR